MYIFCLLCLTVCHVSSVFFFPDDDELTVIPIDVNKIGNQGEGYFVTKFWGETCNNYIYDGYEISKLVDIRDVKKGHHSLSFIGTKPGTQLLVTQPIFPATFVDPLDKVAYEERETNEKIHQGHSSNRIAFGKLSMNEKRETFILDFGGIMLSDTPYGNPADRPLVSKAIVAYKSGTGVRPGGVEVQTLQVRVVWKLLATATAREVTEATPTDEDAELNATFAGLGI